MAAAVAFLGLAAPVQAVHLRGKVMRVGYSGSSTGVYATVGDIYRVGRWTPVWVELSNDDGDQFEGVIEVRQPDADGDEVVASREVAVRGARQFCLYVPGGPPSDDRLGRGTGVAAFTVRVFDREGRLARLHDDKGTPVKELRPVREPVPVSADALLILDMSRPPFGQLDEVRRLERLQDFVTMRCLPAELPDSVAGLELVDVITWDSPDPGGLDTLQSDALLEWVRRGGRLILGAGKNWDSLSQSKFGPVLPARLTGAESTSDGELLRDWLAPDAPRTGLPTITYCPIRRENLLPGAVSILPRNARADEQVWASRRACGRGEVVLVAAELKDVFALTPGDQDRPFLRRELLRLKSSPEPRGNVFYHGTTDVFTRVAAQTAFQTTSGFYFAFAFAFVIAYIVLVTGGTWGWLVRRGGVRHAWVASAVLAAAASGVSLGAVQLVRAWGQGVHEMTVVDGQIGAYEAVATSYLGLKTASHTLLDICVPQQWVKAADSPELRGSLRPYAMEAGSSQQSRFAVPHRYESVAHLGELRSVPFRATLKQFVSTWRGNLDGRIAASLRYNAIGDELDRTSWVENQLGTELNDCYLLYRAASSGFVHVYTLGTLPPNTRVELGRVAAAMEEQHRRNMSQFQALRDRGSGSEEERARWSPPLLRVLLDQSLRAIGVTSTRGRDENSRDQRVIADHAPAYVAPLLLLTFFDDLELATLLAQGQELSRSQGRELEMSSRLEVGSALLIGFSQSPSPLRLCRRKPGSDADAWKPLLPARSAVMYRFMAPVQ